VKLLQRALGAFGYAKIFKPAVRSYQSGQITRLTEDWVPSVQTADVAIRYNLRLLRSRSRDLEQENDWARKYFSVMENNVLGHDGISLRMKCQDPNGNPDIYANRVIKASWDKWCKQANCCLNEEDDFVDVQKLALRSALRDGGILVQIKRNANLNDWGFRLKLLEIDYLDINYSTVLPNGNFIFMGVEKNPDTGKVNGFWLLARHPGEQYFGAFPYYRYFVPREEIIHWFIKERTTQSVGVPSLSSTMKRLNMLDGYEQAELNAAREAAVKGGFFTSERGDTYQGPKDEDGNTLADFSPGQKDELPPGMKFTPYDPQHPTSQHAGFVKHELHGVAAGGGVSYTTLTDDLAEVNFSSMRGGKLEEREQFKKIQGDMIRRLLEPIFEAWLESSMLNKALSSFPFEKFDKFNSPSFRGRRWSWVDPQNDITAALTAIDGGLGTRTDYLEENTDTSDIQETFATLKMEKDLAAKAGLVFTSPTKGGGSPQESKPKENTQKVVDNKTDKTE